MSVKLHFSSPADPSGINRSRSFTGFSSMPRRRSQGYSVTRSTSRTRMPLVKSTKNLGPPTKNISNLEPQPERVETIYKSLRKGLNEYLEADQNELDLLTMQQKDMKRNSRLAFLYDLDKQIRMTERYIRRLEFHISRIEELHESYCIQWRLRDGASNMKQAYNATPSTKGSRESLVQINRNFRECTEDMCTIERTLEIHLGEFHIRMKGLVGFARLCPGDQYEVLIRYGRQRWKLKGRIEADDRQMWDEEEVIFLPHINEDVEIKVAEMKGLMTVLVGTVTCESADFFTAQPQIMIVDVTELGTIKLQLEVMWNPFDSDELSVMSGSVNKYSVSSRKSSLYNWTPPSTPSFRDKYFPQYFGQEDTLPPLHQDAKGTSIFNYLGNGNQNAHLSSVPENEKCHSYTNVEMEEKSCCVGGSAGVQRLSSELSGGAQEDILSVQPTNSPQTLQPDSPNQKQLQMDWTPGLAESVLHVGPQPSQQLSRGKPPELSSLDHIKTHTLNQLTPTHSSTRGNVTHVPPEKNTRADLISVNIGAILQDLLTDLRTVQISYKELKRLEQQFLHFRNSLKESSISRSESTVSLSVETALESFDFLNVDISEDTLSYFGSVRIKDERNSTHTKPNLCHHDLSSKNGDSGTKRKQPLALTSENHYLDQTLLTHLQMCRWLLQRFTSIGSIAILQNSILEELSQQILVLDTLAIIYHKKTGNVRTVEEVIPKAQKVKLLSSFWRKCSGTESVLYSSAERFLTQLRNYYTQKVNAKCLGLSERVFRTLLHQIVGCCGFLLSASLSEEVLTIFQFFHYVKTHSITDLGTHLMKLTKEVSLAEALQTTQRVKTLKKLKGKHITEFQPLHQTLESISVLQLDENPKVTQAAISFLSNASVHRHFRDKALAHYTDALQDKDLHIQKGACLALKHLKAVESIEQIVSLCQSEAEDVRDTARETVLSFGEKGNLALEKLERMWYDLKEDGIQNATTQITIL